ncbi:hypothetical protein FV223_29415 [Methylobacterium sp. WL116]|nr:hypothetical protein FV223_29415 [Methylobacterium sp. WL116]
MGPAHGLADHRPVGGEIGLRHRAAGRAHRLYGSGKLSLAELIAPAEALARAGIPVTGGLADSLPRSAGLLGRWPSTRRIFFRGDVPLPRGDSLVQADLADTLRAVAEGGPDAFYAGPIAGRIAAAVRAPIAARSKPSRMFRISIRWTPPDEGGGIETTS